jgi:hypothetical protein
MLPVLSRNLVDTRDVRTLVFSNPPNGGFTQIDSTLCPCRITSGQTTLQLGGRGHRSLSDGSSLAALVWVNRSSSTCCGNSFSEHIRGVRSLSCLLLPQASPSSQWVSFDLVSPQRTLLVLHPLTPFLMHFTIPYPLYLLVRFVPTQSWSPLHASSRAL